MFTKIREIKDRVLYAKTGTLEERIKKYNEELAKNVAPSTYIKYVLSQFDIYVDLELIIVMVQNVFPNVTAANIYKQVQKHKGKSQLLII